MNRDIEFTCNNVDITPYHGHSVNVIVSNADIDDIILDVLCELKPKDIVENYDINYLLDEIGIEKCKTYFDLEEIDG